MPYFLLYTINLFFLFLSQVANIKYRKTCIQFIFLFLIIFSGFRDHVGIDYPTYVELFNDAIKNNEVEIKEYGFILIMKFIGIIGGTKQLLFLTCAIITNIFIYKFIIRLDAKYYFGAILVYITVGPFYLNSLNLIRQYAAMGIFIYSTIFIQQHKFFKYSVILLLTAFCFHLSVLLLIPLYFILYRKIGWLTKFILFLIFTIGSKIFIYLISLTPFGVYINMIFSPPSLFLTILFGSISLYFIYKEATNDFQEDYRVFFNMNFFSFLLLSLLAVNNGFLSEIILRMNNYFMLSMIFLIPYSVYNNKRQPSKISYAYFLFIFLSIYFFKNAIISGEEVNLLPYNIDLNLFY